eukprot:TRINITY_DN64783_c0_g1_i1.p1 TRINITY_DN64783_c0_g1~~TRINITY_DN64783_c0_g1_i1.p1  ORF type:complete len:155 (-),score=9.76 TRINITY_DN64783_c0_g1_i1:69-533(-)
MGLQPSSYSAPSCPRQTAAARPGPKYVASLLFQMCLAHFYSGCASGISPKLPIWDVAHHTCGIRHSWQTGDHHMSCKSNLLVSPLTFLVAVKILGLDWAFHTSGTLRDLQSCDHRSLGNASRLETAGCLPRCLPQPRTLASLRHLLAMFYRAAG